MSGEIFKVDDVEISVKNNSNNIVEIFKDVQRNKEIYDKNKSTEERRINKIVSEFILNADILNEIGGWLVYDSYYARGEQYIKLLPTIGIDENSGKLFDENLKMLKKLATRIENYLPYGQPFVYQDEFSYHNYLFIQLDNNMFNYDRHVVRNEGIRLIENHLGSFNLVIPYNGFMDCDNRWKNKEIKYSKNGEYMRFWLKKLDIHDVDDSMLRKLPQVSKRVADNFIGCYQTLL